MILYLAGIAAVLYFRPSYMFKTNGQWKEFALRNGDSTTVFPFWMFCVSWAFTSYILVQLLGGYILPVASAAAAKAATKEEEKPALPKMKTKSNVASVAPSIRGLSQEDSENEDSVMPLPVKKTKKAQAQAQTQTQSKEKIVEVMKPGYYKMDPTATNSKGVPRYIYMGPEAPAEDSSSEEETS